MEEDDKAKWELVCVTDDGDYLERISIPGGWLYRDVFYNKNLDRTMMAMCFVPMPPPGAPL